MTRIICDYCGEPIHGLYPRLELPDEPDGPGAGYYPTYMESGGFFGYKPGDTQAWFAPPVPIGDFHPGCFHERYRLMTEHQAEA